MASLSTVGSWGLTVIAFIPGCSEPTQPKPSSVQVKPICSEQVCLASSDLLHKAPSPGWHATSSLLLLKPSRPRAHTIEPYPVIPCQHSIATYLLVVAWLEAAVAQQLAAAAEACLLASQAAQPQQTVTQPGRRQSGICPWPQLSWAAALAVDACCWVPATCTTLGVTGAPISLRVLQVA